MGSNELKKFELNKSDKLIGFIAVGFGLFIAYKIWGEYVTDCIIVNKIFISFLK